MEVQPDFKEFFALRNKNKVEYLVVGSYALAFHGLPRFTGDIDILIKADAVNAGNLVSALSEFGFGSLGLEVEDFTTAGKVIQLGVPPVRIDLLTSLSGVSWEEAYMEKASGLFGDVSVNYIGLMTFKKNKRATARNKDLADLDALEEDSS